MNKKHSTTSEITLLNCRILNNSSYRQKGARQCESGFTRTGLHMLPDHSQINIPLQAWETLRACLTPRQHALERSLTPVNLSDLRDLQLCPATGPPRPLIVLHCRPLQSQPLQPPVPVPATSRSPATTAATAVLLVLLMAIVMNEDLWSSLFIGRPRARRWIGCYFCSAIGTAQRPGPGTGGTK